MYSGELTSGNISRQLALLAAPLILGNILQQFYNTIDALVVGRYAGMDEFASIGIAGTVMNLFMFAIVGCCTGFSVLFASCYGAGDNTALRRQHFTALTSGMASTLLMAIIGLLLMKPILLLIRTPPELQEYTAVYLRYIFLSLPATFLYNFYASLLRSSGDTKAALLILAAAVLANLVLDILFVAELEMGIEGAAIATAVTQLISAVLCLLWVCSRHKEVLISASDCHPSISQYKRTMHFGLVTALHQSGLYIGKILVQGAVNTAGTEVISAYTAATRIEGFANSFGDSGSAATSIMTAQNYGAGNRQRTEEVFWKSLKLLSLLGLACSFVLYFSSGWTIPLLIGSSEGITYTNAVRYLRIVALFYVLCFTGNTFAGYFDGIGKVQIPMLGALSHITLRVILSWLLISQLQLDAVALATGIGWIFVNTFWALVKRHYSSSRRP